MLSCWKGNLLLIATALKLCSQTSPVRPVWVWCSSQLLSIGCDHAVEDGQDKQGGQGRGENAADGVSDGGRKDGFDPQSDIEEYLKNQLEKACCDGMYYGMGIMTHRTTFALDEKTAQRLKRLSAKWHVSQAEVVRRSLEQAESADALAQKDPEALLQRLHAKGGGLAAEDAAAYLAQVREDRKKWRGR